MCAAKQSGHGQSYTAGETKGRETVRGGAPHTAGQVSLVGDQREMI